MGYHAPVFKRTAAEVIKGALAPVLTVAVIIFMIVYGLNQAEISSRSEGLRMLQESIDRAVAACYAIEGSYPPSLEYIENNYGVRVDKDKYIVHYNILMSNIRPDVTILEVIDYGM